MTDSADTVDLTDKSLFRHWSPVTIRFSDEDRQGHVNNVSYAAYVEAGRIPFIIDLMGRVGEPDDNFVLASLRINYLAEMHFPGIVEVGTMVRRVGTASVVLGHGLFNHDSAAATAESTAVFVDGSSGRSKPIADDLRAEFVKELEAVRGQSR